MGCPTAENAIVSIDRSVPSVGAAEGRAADPVGLTERYARDLLAEAGSVREVTAPTESRLEFEDEPHRAWAESGAMALTGFRDGAMLAVPAPLATAANGAWLALRAIAGERCFAGSFPGAALLGERAAIAGLSRGGATAPGGWCRLLGTRRGWLAVNLARSSDRAMLPAWLEAELGIDADAEAPSEAIWSPVARVLATREAAAWLERARLMGLAVAEVPERVSGANGRVASVEFVEGQAAQSGENVRAPRVLDLSSLWAGPLCGSLLSMAGADVVKCESESRPDGARRGPIAFHDLMNAGKRSVVLDFDCAAGRRQLAGLIDRADIVIESARPRAMRGLGVVAERWIEERGGRTWISITGYGRNAPEGDWVAFGDDAAAASGLSWAVARAHGLEAPLLCGDAIADPLAGLHAAVFALANHERRTSRLISLSLRGVVAAILALGGQPSFADAMGRSQLERAGALPARPPRARAPGASAPGLGADTRAVFDDWGGSG